LAGLPGQRFCFTKDSAYQLHAVKNRILINDSFDRKFIEDNLQSVCAVTDSTIFIHYVSPLRQYENYFVIHEDNNASISYSVGRFNKEQGKESSIEQASNLVAFPITLPPVPIPAGAASGPIVEAFLKGYEKIFQSYFKSEFNTKYNYPDVYSAIFRLKGKQLIFNREGSCIVWLDDSGKIELSIPFVTTYNGKDFSLVHFDMETERFYLQFENNASTEFVEIDPLTGHHLKNITVKSFKHIEQCSFKNDRLFFLFQPDFGNRLKKIYSIVI
jgi:hypothetical protein